MLDVYCIYHIVLDSCLFNSQSANHTKLLSSVVLATILGLWDLKIIWVVIKKKDKI